MTPRDGSVNIPVGSGHHSEFLGLSHNSLTPSNLHQPWWSLFTNMSRKLGAPITRLGEAPINLLSVFAESYHQIVTSYSLVIFKHCNLESPIFNRSELVLS